MKNGVLEHSPAPKRPEIIQKVLEDIIRTEQELKELERNQEALLNYLRIQSTGSDEQLIKEYQKKTTESQENNQRIEQLKSKLEMLKGRQSILEEREKLQEEIDSLEARSSLGSSFQVSVTHPDGLVETMDNTVRIERLKVDVQRLETELKVYEVKN